LKVWQGSHSFPRKKRIGNEYFATICGDWAGFFLIRGVSGGKKGVFVFEEQMERMGRKEENK
jgi:hypothetical protein